MGIRPSEREKGIGTQMLALAIEKSKKLGINRILICCDKDNIASARTIIKMAAYWRMKLLMRAY